MNPITLSEFLSRERERLTAFGEFWRKQMAERPDQEPAELWPSDWDEQLQTFLRQEGAEL